MIRASNQLLPKTKVVDLFFLYNFYFGQISSSYINFEFQLVKLCSKSFQTISTQLLYSPVTPYARPCRRPATAPTTTTRRSSTNLAHRARAPILIPTEPCPFSPSPFFLALTLHRARTEPPPAFVPTAPRRPSSISACPNLPHLALHLLHPSPSSIEPYAGRIELQTAGRH